MPSWSYSQEEYQEVGDACLSLPTLPAVLCPGQLSQRRSTRLGANKLGQIPALSLASHVSPTGQVTSPSLTICSLGCRCQQIPLSCREVCWHHVRKGTQSVLNKYPFTQPLSKSPRGLRDRHPPA